MSVPESALRTENHALQRGVHQGRSLSRNWNRGLRFISPLFAVILASILPTTPAASQSYPNSAVTLLVPYAPGGATDVFARLIAEGLNEKLKQPFVVENRAGAATQLAAAALVNAPADGRTLMMAAGTTLAVNPSLYNKLSYNVNDIVPVALAGSAYFVLVANPSVPATNLTELISYIKSKPAGSLSYGSAGNGSPHHLFMEMFLARIGAKMNQVPYKGSAPGVMDVVAGNIPIMIVDLPSAQQLIESGKLRAFGLTSEKRAPTAPTIPTIAEAGLPGYSGLAWVAVVARKGTPPAVVELLNKIITDHIRRPEITEKIYATGIQPITGTVDEFAQFIASETEKWSKLINEVGIPKVN